MDPTPLGWQVGDLNGDGQVDDTDVLIFNTAGNYNRGANPLSTIDLKTTAAFPFDPTKISAAANAALPGGTPRSATEIKMTLAGGSLPDGTDLGLILQPNLDANALAAALTLTFNYTNSGQFAGGVAGLIVPEPATLSLLGLGAMGLMGRRRKRRR